MTSIAELKRKALLIEQASAKFRPPRVIERDKRIAELEAALREARDHCLADDISTAVTVIDWVLKEQGE